MIPLLEVMLTNAILATFLAACVGAFSLVRARPPVLHALYVVILVRLLMPPIFDVPLPLIGEGRMSPVSVQTAALGHDPPQNYHAEHVDVGGSKPQFEQSDSTSQTQEPALAPPPRPAPSEAGHVRSHAEGASLPLLDNPYGADEVTRPVGNLDPVATASGPSVVPSPPPRAQAWPTVAEQVRWAGYAWLLGCCLWLVIAASRMSRMHRALRAAAMAPPWTRSIVERVATRLQLERLPRVVTVDVPTSPAIWPIGPYLVLPRRLLERLGEAELTPLIAHELVHLRRRDHWVRLLELLVTFFYWWLPTLWWVRRRLRSVEEECCDAWVVQSWPGSAATYARSLIEAIELLAGPPRHKLAHPATGIGEARALQSRLRKIMQARQPYRLSRLGWLTVGVAAAVCWVLTPGTEAEVQVAQPVEADDEVSPNTEPSEATWTFDRLPPTCDVLYKTLAPDEEKVAWVGSNLDDAGTREYGLFVIELRTGSIRRLLDGAIKTAPAWSSDSRYVAIGNGSGYVTRHPLVVVDVETGEVDQTGAMGVGAAWSPDGTEIACSTEIQGGGSWSRGVPVDGRIGIWNVEQRQMRLVTPPAFNLYISGNSAMAGAVRPAWSPDGRWIAFEMVVRVQRGDDKETRHELWAVNRAGTEMRVLMAAFRPYRWSDDGLSVISLDSGGTVNLANAPVVTAADWPQPDADLVEAQATVQAALARARGFDPTPIFNRNRPWQNPHLEHLHSVEFTHRMSPTRLDERFSWRADGACSVEVIHREDEHADEQVGRLWLLTPSGEQHTQGAGARYPKREALSPDQVLQETSSHLMGTRMNCVAQDWARHPDWFALSDVPPSDVGSQQVLELRPTSTRDRRRYYLNVGAMFHTTSWSYLHHLAVRRTELIIDAKTGRVLKEIDYTGDDEPIVFEFTDWLDVGDGQSVPQSIRVAVPAHEFHCEYRFRWLPQRLWLLESGKSWFDGKEPQLEQIVDLGVNGDNPDVDRHLKQFRERLDMLESGRDVGQERPIRTIPFELGRAVPLTWTQPGSPAARVRELRFAVGETGEKFREVWVHPTARVELELDGSEPRPRTAEPAQLVLYDDRGRPVHAFSIPLGAMELLRRRAADFAVRIHNCSSMWLSPDIETLPTVRYTFHASHDREDRYSTGDASNPHFVRGVTMTLALDALTRDPDRYRMPLSFEANLDGRPVEVAIITGPSFGWVFGNGIEHSWRGYTVSKNTAVVVVIDRKTGRPLLERYGDTEVHFLEYVEPRPGQFAPRRIVVRRNGEQRFDFRFQVLGGRAWLFDRSYSTNGERIVYTDAIRIDGRVPQDVSASEASAAEPTADLDWSALTERRLLADADHPLARHLASSERPFANRNFALLTRITLSGEGSARIDLGRSILGHSVRSWSLIHAGGRYVALAESPAVEEIGTSGAVPIQWGQVTPIHVAARKEGRQADDDSGISWLRTICLDRADDGWVTGTVELVSRQHQTEHWSVIAAVLLDQQGRPIASTEAEHIFRVKRDVYSEHILLGFGALPSDVTPTHVCAGFGTTLIGMPMGSTWGRFLDRRPLFPVGQLLSSEAPEVVQVGLQVLYRSVEEYIQADEPRDADRVQYAMQGIAPYTRYFEKLFAESKNVNTLALLSRLAGHSRQRRFASDLAGLLDHADANVRDAAAIGLGLLGDDRALERIRAIYQRTKDRSNLSQHARRLLAESRIALEYLGEALDAE